MGRYGPLGFLKALLTDLSGGFRPRKFKNPAEELPLWRIAQDIKDYKNLLNSQPEVTDEQWQELLDKGEQPSVHTSKPSKDELEEMRLQASLAELREFKQQAAQKEQESSEAEASEQEQEEEITESSSDPVEGSYFTLGLNEEAFDEDSFDVDLEE